MQLAHPMSLAGTARLLKGTLLHGDAVFSSVSVDTRSLVKGGLFVALKGSKVDGSAYLKEAETKGASAAIVAKGYSQRAIESSIPCIVVDDSLVALQAFAHSYVNTYSKANCIGITGSCGKTTTKDALAAILSVKGKTAKTPGNLNSEIGLPLSVLQLDETYRWGVFEMGVDHEGEMGRMLSVIKPEVGILTNIGISHLEKFGTRERIAHEKGQIFHQAISSGFIGTGSPFIRQIERENHIYLREYGPEGLWAIDRGLEGWDISLYGRKFHVNAVGRHLLTDIAGAIVVAHHLGVTEEEIAEGLDGFTPSLGRTTILDGDVTIIEDCYNSSLDSTNSILECISSLAWKGRKKVALGTMKELGSYSVSAHENVAWKILSSDISSAFLYGHEMEVAYDVLRKNHYRGELAYTEDFDQLTGAVKGSLSHGDLLLVKGSRSMAMERLIPAIRNVG